MDWWNDLDSGEKGWIKFALIITAFGGVHSCMKQEPKPLTVQQRINLNQMIRNDREREQKCERIFGSDAWKTCAHLQEDY